MNETLTELEKKAGPKWTTFKRLHNLILSLGPEIEYRIFPIYVGYYLGDKNVAIVYFRGNLVSDNELDVGLALEKKPNAPGFVNAQYMHYNGVNYSIKLKTTKEMSKQCISAIKSVGKNTNI